MPRYRNATDPQGVTVQIADNSQFSEEQRSEAYRIESMQQFVRQTKALETIRGIAVVFMVLTALGVVMWLVSLFTAGQL